MPSVMPSYSTVSDPPPTTGSAVSFLKMSVKKCGLWVCRQQLCLLPSSKSVSHTVSRPSPPSLPRSPAAPSVMEILHPLSSSLPSPALFALCRHSAFTFAPFKWLGGVSSLPLGETNRRPAPAECTLRLSVLWKANEGCTSLLCCKYTSEF